MTTPKEVKTLKDNEIFVFGSNLNGSHGGGAALLAKSFGAEEGIGEGLTGQCYAFPTLDKKMKKVSKKSLVASKEKLYKCATENPDKLFLVTKVGCGIAGFKETEVKDIFKGDKPTNIVLPAGWSVIKGYKAFDKGLLCRGMQYELGKWFEHNGEIAPCASGFHFCKSLGDVYSYYSFGSVVCEVESDGEVIDEGNKSVTNRIRLIRILNAETEARNNSNSTSTGNMNTGDWNTGDWNTGNMNTGNMNTGDRNTGNMNTGDRNTGNMNTGDWNTGDRNTGDWNTGDWNTGFFNTKTPDEILVFGKKCKQEVWNRACKPSCLYFDVVKWIDFSDMTDEEKENYPTAKHVGGYLKKLDYKQAFTESMKKASEEDIKLIKKLPNFNKKIFFEISGFEIK